MILSSRTKNMIQRLQQNKNNNKNKLETRKIFMLKPIMVSGF
jgi:hypothetical protein